MYIQKVNKFKGYTSFFLKKSLWYSIINSSNKNHELSQVLSGCRCFGTITELFIFSSKNIKLFWITFMGELNPDWIYYLLILAGLMLKPKLHYFGHLMQRANSLQRPWCWRKIEGKRRGWQRIRWLDSTTDSMDMNMSKLWETVF